MHRFSHLPVEDELEIRSVFARYGHLADAGDPNFVQLFTEDATWTRLNSPPASQGGSGLPPVKTRAGPGIFTGTGGNSPLGPTRSVRLYHTPAARCIVSA